MFIAEIRLVNEVTALDTIDCIGIRNTKARVTIVTIELSRKKSDARQQYATSRSMLSQMSSGRPIRVIIVV